MQTRFIKLLPPTLLEQRQSQSKSHTGMDYNTPGGILARNQFLPCLLAGLLQAALKLVKYTKLLEIIQDT